MDSIWKVSPCITGSSSTVEDSFLKTMVLPSHSWLSYQEITSCVLVSNWPSPKSLTPDARANSHPPLKMEVTTPASFYEEKGNLSDLSRKGYIPISVTRVSTTVQGGEMPGRVAGFVGLNHIAHFCCGRTATHPRKKKKALASLGIQPEKGSGDRALELVP